MDYKKVFKLLLIYLISIILVNIIYVVGDDINQKRLISKTQKYSQNYSEKVMRFKTNINSGTYNFIDEKSSSYVSGFKQFDNEFRQNSIELSISKNTVITYSEYIITDKFEYFYVSIGERKGWIKCNLPTDKKKIDYLKGFISGSTDIEVFPFNSGTYALISGNTEQYIVNLDNKQITWTRGSYYESPRVNIDSDTLICGGDLSSTTYEFSKDGKLIRSYNANGFNLYLIKNILNAILIYLILNCIRRLLIFKGINTVVKIVINSIFIVTTILIFPFLIVLILFSI